MIPLPHRNEIKIIALLREPISRDLSRYNNQVENVIRGKQRNLGGCFLSLIHKTQPWIPTYTDVASCEINIWNKCANTSVCDSKLIIGMYDVHLKNWAHWWRQKNIFKIVNYEYLQSSLEDIFSFLNLTYSYYIKFNTVNQNEYPNKVKLPECNLTTRLHAIYRPHNEELYKMFPIFPMFSQPMCNTKEQRRISAQFRHIHHSSHVEFL